MFLQQKSSGHMVEVLEPEALWDMFAKQVRGRYQYGEDMPDAELFEKKDLQFLSGEALPQCWVNPEYRTQEVEHSFYRRFGNAVSRIF